MKVVVAMVEESVQAENRRQFMAVVAEILAVVMEDFGESGSDYLFAIVTPDAKGRCSYLTNAAPSLAAPALQDLARAMRLEQAESSSPGVH